MVVEPLRGWLLRHRRVVVAAASGVVVVSWMTLPALRSGGDVVVVGSESSSALFPAVLGQLRETGRDAVSLVVDDPCGATSAFDGTDLRRSIDIAVIVVEPGDCSAAAATAGIAAAEDRGLQPIVVLLPGADAVESGVAVVDTEMLLGPPGELTQPCEWWDRPDALAWSAARPCRDDDTVLVRTADGGLTVDGMQRVARMLAVAIG